MRFKKTELLGFELWRISELWVARVKVPGAIIHGSKKNIIRDSATVYIQSDLTKEPVDF